MNTVQLELEKLLNETKVQHAISHDVAHDPDSDDFTMGYATGQEEVNGRLIERLAALYNIASGVSTES